MSWVFKTEGHDGPDYAGVVLLFMGGRLRVPLILKGCPFNECAKKHDAEFDETDWAAGETSDEADENFRLCCNREALRIAGTENPHLLAHLIWLGTQLYNVAHAWGEMRSRLQKWHLNWR